MTCNKRNLMACFHSDVNVTFVFFNNSCLNIDVYFDDSLVFVQAVHNKIIRKILKLYCLSALLVDAFLC